MVHLFWKLLGNSFKLSINFIYDLVSLLLDTYPGVIMSYVTYDLVNLLLGIYPSVMTT